MHQISRENIPIVRKLETRADIFDLYKEIGGESQPLFRIMELAHRAGARYCLQQNDSSNDEWIAEYSGLYSKIYPQVPNYVMRLDFLSADPAKCKDYDYYGYVSIRPGPMRTVVESIVVPPSTKTSGSHFLLCKGDFETTYTDHSGNHVTKIIKNACPFVQQDGVIGICAHASIRMLSMILACNYHTCRKLTIKDIQDKVTVMPLLEGSHLPSTGLASFEIVSAIEGMEAAAVLYLFEKGRERTRGLSIERVIYPYVESGLPVIVGIETLNAGHSVLVVGHTFDVDSWRQLAEYGYYPSSPSETNWIPSYLWTPEFIIQDDNFGPYMSCPRTILGIFAQHVIVPIPNDCPVFLPGFAAEAYAYCYLSSELTTPYFLAQTRSDVPWRDVFTSIFDKGNAVLRTLLVKKETFIKHLNDVHASSELTQVYEAATLPSWVWLVEISVPGLYSDCQKVGEILINPTYPVQHVRKGDEPLLAMRLFDVVSIGNEFTDIHVTSDNVPLPLLTREPF